MREFTGHNDRVESARFSANGKHIISSSWDGTMRIWDVESGEEIFNVEVSELWGQAIPSAFSSDGKYLVALSEDGSVKLWNWPSLQDLIDQTRERFKDRPLTPEERHQYYLE